MCKAGWGDLTNISAQALHVQERKGKKFPIHDLGIVIMLEILYFFSPSIIHKVDHYNLVP